MLCGILIYNLFLVTPLSSFSSALLLPPLVLLANNADPNLERSQRSRLDLPNLLIPRYPQKLIHPCILLIPNPGRPIKILLDPRPHLVDSVEPEDHDAPCHTRVRLGWVDGGVRVRGRTRVVGGDEGSAED
jgi:hypothetical protein